MDLKSKIILISGPTASGKSEFAIKVAKKINGEIINSFNSSLSILSSLFTNYNATINSVPYSWGFLFVGGWVDLDVIRYFT